MASTKYISLINNPAVVLSLKVHKDIVKNKSKPNFCYLSVSGGRLTKFNTWGLVQNLQELLINLHTAFILKY